MKRIVAVAILSAILGAHIIFYPPGRDQGIFEYIGWQMSEGKLPYIDLWDFKPPAIYLVYLFSQKIFGHNTWGIRALEIFWQTLAAIAIFIFAFRFYKNSIAAFFAAVLYALVLFQQSFWDLGQPDGLLNLFLALSFVLALKKRALWWLAGGLCLGAAFWFKYPAGIFVLPFAILLLDTKKLRPFFFSALGFLSAIAAGLILLSASGMLAPLLDVQNRAVTTYSVSSLFSVNFWGLLFEHIGNFGLPYYWGTILWFFALIAIIAGAKNMGFEVALIFSGIVCIVIQGKLFYYHALPLIFALSIPAGSGFQIAWNFVKNLKARRIIFYIVVSVLIFSAIEYRLFCLSQGIASLKYTGSLNDAYASIGTRGDYDFKASLELAQYTKSRSMPSDTVYIWGFEPIVYYLSERRCPSKFIYNVPLFGAFEKLGNRSQLLSSLIANKPKFFIIQKNDYLPHVTRRKINSLEALKEFPELSDFLKNNYAVEKNTENFLILSRSDHNP